MAKKQPAKKKPKVSREAAQAALDRDLKTAVKFSEEGKPLNSIQRKLLAARAEGGDADGGQRTAKVVDLAKALGVERQTVYRLMKKAGCPGKESNGEFHVGKWLEWRNGGGGTEEGEPPLTWAQRKQKAEATRLERELAKEAGNLMDRDEQEALYVATWAPIYSYLENGAGALASVVEMKSAKAAEEVIRKFFHKVLRQVVASDAPKAVVQAMLKMLEEGRLGGGEK